MVDNTLLIIQICRLILNLQKVPQPENMHNMANTEIQLTSFIYMSDSGPVDAMDLIDTLSTCTTPNSNDQTVSTMEESPSNSPNSHSLRQ
jgi:hypothetical protein